MAGNTQQVGVSVTSRVLAVLGTFDVRHQSLSLTEIARRAGIPTATVHRLLSELEKWGAVERGADGRYRIGLRLWELGSLTAARTRLREVALPYLQALHEATRAQVFVAVADECDVVYIERFGGAYPPRGDVTSRHPVRQPMDQSAAGLALLAYREHPQPRPAGRADARGLHEILRTARRLGCVVLPDAGDRGAMSIAAPVLGANGVAVAAMGLSARAPHPVQRWREALLSAASGMHRMLLGRADDVMSPAGSSAG
ncbi:IclR family transcriptional regulator [Streptomyces sp. B1866]|uniref:IclR family transcriptional regulator n=1 Tax=Streptomyces sp. B1866 TaxID=3075431 RepID=UPI00288F7176|nr:IclR family transcriptional regulator [Streptomyces sp. B1866]MDT3396535.1 IclR family transcriptional regulator [Streptomyces sp. B1866]